MERMDPQTDALGKFDIVEMLDYPPADYMAEDEDRYGRLPQQIVVFRIIATSAIQDVTEFGWWATRLIVQDYFVGLGGPLELRSATSREYFHANDQDT